MREDEVVGSIQICDAEVFTVEKVTVKTKEGRTNGRHVVRHPGSVAILAQNESHEVALVQVFRPALDRRQWELPAGHIKPGQDVVNVAREELRSEVGVDATEIDVLCQVVTSPGHSDHQATIVVLAT
jgi:ADP-ribose pyrophosphatase